MAEHAPGGAYEHRDVNVGAVVRFGIGLFVVTAIALIAMAGLWWLLAKKEQKEQGAELPASEVATPWQGPPAPRLQVSTYSDLEVLRRKKEKLLNSYGWVDKSAGTVRIPIDRAMELVAKRGIPPARGKEGARDAKR
jgi:hypothetical protein